MKADKIFVQKSFKYFFEIFALKVNCILASLNFYGDLNVGIVS